MVNRKLSLFDWLHNPFASDEFVVSGVDVKVKSHEYGRNKEDMETSLWGYRSSNFSFTHIPSDGAYYKGVVLFEHNPVITRINYQVMTKPEKNGGQFNVLYNDLYIHWKENEHSLLQRICFAMLELEGSLAVLDLITFASDKLDYWKMRDWLKSHNVPIAQMKSVAIKQGIGIDLFSPDLGLDSIAKMDLLMRMNGGKG